MAADIVMPRLPDSMTEGTIGSRLKQQEADIAGVLFDLNAKAGDTLAIGAALACVGDPAEPAQPAPSADGATSPPPAQSPQAAVLAVGSVAPRPRVDADGAVVVRPTVTLTLSCDHRVLYDADAAQLLARIRDLLEEPLRLAL